MKSWTYACARDVHMYKTCIRADVPGHLVEIVNLFLNKTKTPAGSLLPPTDDIDYPGYPTKHNIIRSITIHTAEMRRCLLEAVTAKAVHISLPAYVQATEAILGEMKRHLPRFSTGL